jgi:predicted nucleotidyltransferase
MQFVPGQTVAGFYFFGSIARGNPRG